jgi:hypothetical protein
MMMQLSPTQTYRLPKVQAPSGMQVAPAQRNGSIRISEEAIDKFTKHIDHEDLQRMGQHADALNIMGVKHQLLAQEKGFVLQGFTPLRLKPGMLDLVERLEYKAKRMFGNPTDKTPLEMQDSYSYRRQLGDFNEEDGSKRILEIAVAPHMFEGKGYILKAQVLNLPHISHEKAVALNKQFGLPEPKMLSTIDMQDVKLTNELEASLNKTLEQTYGLEKGHDKDFSITPATLPRPVKSEPA